MKEKTLDEETLEAIQGYIGSLESMKETRCSIFYRYADHKIDKLKDLCVRIENR